LEVLFVIFLFYLCLAFNIICALGLMKVPKISDFFTENSKYIVPFMLIGLGLFIIQDSLLWPSNW
jgi:cadmium resistance protein CadD (predicted permease)